MSIGGIDRWARFFSKREKNSTSSLQPLFIHHKKARCDVHVLAYGGSRPLEAVANHRFIKIHHLPAPPAWTNSNQPSSSSSEGSKAGGGSRRSSSSSKTNGGLVRVVALVVKALLQLLSLLYATLWVLPRPKGGILAQTPPALPTLPALAVAARLRRARLVVDWHNFAFTIMSLSMGRRHPLVRVTGERERKRSRGKREKRTKRGLTKENEKMWEKKTFRSSSRSAPSASGAPPPRPTSASRTPCAASSRARAGGSAG